MKEESKYEAYIFCKNCQVHKKILINKGVLVDDVECPNCGNLSIKIDPNGQLFDRPKQQPTNYR